MRRFAFVLAFVALTSSVSAETLVLAHHYSAVGLNPDGSKYSGTVTIDIVSDTTFTIQWDINGATYQGFGMRRNDSVAATYQIQGEPGLVIYQVQGNGLDGIWAIKGENGSGTEHLTPTD
jgi:hypothetical protein